MQNLKNFLKEEIDSLVKIAGENHSLRLSPAFEPSEIVVKYKTINVGLYSLKKMLDLENRKVDVNKLINIFREFKRYSDPYEEVNYAVTQKYAELKHELYKKKIEIFK